MMSEQDFERLSAYLDHELSAPETARLEQRLAHDADLQAALRDLRRQTRALRALPAVKPPRVFTLTAEQAQAVRRPRRPFFEALFPAVRLATSLSAAAFAVVLAAAVLGPNTGGLPTANKDTLSAAGQAEAPAAALAPPAADAQLRTTAELTETMLSASAAVESGGGAAEAYSAAGEPADAALAPAPDPSAAALAPPPFPNLWPVAAGFGALTDVLAGAAWLLRRR